MRLRQPQFTYHAWKPFTKNKERIQKFKETEDLRYMYQKKLEKTYFQHDLADGNFKDLPRRTASHKVVRVKSFNIARNSIQERIQSAKEGGDQFL